MRSVRVQLRERSYDVLIASGLLEHAGDHLAPFLQGGRLAVVSDEQVWAAQGAGFRQALESACGEPILVASGEASKDWETLSHVIDRLAALGIERGDTVLAFGGGVIGDLAGLAAALFKRGCRLVQVPTTLLAQVDSSVGGKTAINIAAGKNLVGTFHQPSLVLIDPKVLATLPERELRAGYAEVVKMGLIADAGFFAWCEANGAALLAGDEDARLRAIETCVRAKAAIVGEDERETSGRRALLNLGHTFGHAIETLAGYSGDMLHGEAVAIGTILAFRFSVERGLCTAEDASRVEAHFRAVGLPTETGFPSGPMVDVMISDKKAEGGLITLILAEGIGRGRLAPGIEAAEILSFLDRR